MILTDPDTAAAPAGREAVVGPLPGREHWLARYRSVRDATHRLTEPLATEDYVIQSMPDVSPAKWHLGHTSWFFEQFLLVDGPAADPGYRPFHERFAYIFNSYYVTVGDRHCRIARGTLSRPTVAEVFDYRRHVDEHVERLIGRAGEEELAKLAPLLEIGLNHEQQHQELLLTDIKHVFSCNPLYPVFASNVEHRMSNVQRRSAGGAVDDPSARAREQRSRGASEAQHAHHDLNFIPFTESLRELGHTGDGFAYDNETPRHKVYLHAFALADRLVTNREFLEFIEAGGYRDVPLWLSAGAALVAQDPANWSHPFYWHRGEDGRWLQFTLSGLVALDPDEPVCHLSYYEADAYARWRGCRLPTEFEWEAAAMEAGCDPGEGNFVEDGFFHPRAVRAEGGGQRAGERRLGQMFGDVWEWTASQYMPYPGYRPPPGALGEYNGKFMCNQLVLRGGSCATPRSHIRATYRNFFPPEARWQFSGLRLARDGS